VRESEREYVNEFPTPRQTLTRRALLRSAGAVAGLAAARFSMSPMHVGASDALALSSLTPAMTLSPPTATIPSSLFGMHIHRATAGTPWPHAPFKVWQLWDAGVMWPDLEPRRGAYQWTKLDALVALAQQHGVEPVLVLGLTPTWASARPEEVSDYGPGTSPAEPANIQDWTSYVTAVATRYRGRIRAFEIWNEPNCQYFSGNVMDIFRLTQVAHDALKRVDPAIQVVSPSFMNDPNYLDVFLGYGGGQYIDVLGYHFYTSPGPPEDMVPSVSRVKRVMANRGLATMPIWNTEIGWQSDNFVDDDQRMGFVGRTALINWALGIDRFSWYAWDNHDWCKLWMTEQDDATLAPGATAYATIQQWLVGSRMASCAKNADDTWTCTVIQPDGRTANIVWNSQRFLSFTAPPSWNVASVKSLNGGSRRIDLGERFMVGASPVLLESLVTAPGPRPAAPSAEPPIVPPSPPARSQPGSGGTMLPDPSPAGRRGRPY
jgi:hypothetical protein